MTIIKLVPEELGILFCGIGKITGNRFMNWATFQRFNDLAFAREMKDWLQKKGIESKIENNQKYFNPDFAFNKLDAEILVKLRPEDFDKANHALDNYYRERLENIDANYYLFDF